MAVAVATRCDDVMTSGGPNRPSTVKCPRGSRRPTCSLQPAAYPSRGHSLYSSTRDQSTAVGSPFMGHSLCIVRSGLEVPYTPTFPPYDVSELMTVPHSSSQYPAYNTQGNTPPRTIFMLGFLTMIRGGRTVYA